MSYTNYTEVEKAFKTIKQAMIEDGPSEPGSYAHCWHSNIAMMCYDAIHQGDIDSFDYDSGKMCHEDRHRIANDAASRFMKLCFDVDTKQ